MASHSASGNQGAGEATTFITPESVSDALGALREFKGSTLTSLKRFFRANVPSDDLKSKELQRQLKLAVAKGLHEGQFVKAGRKLALELPEEGGSKRRRRADPSDENLSTKLKRARRQKRAKSARRGRRLSRRRRSRRRRRGRRGSRSAKRGRSSRRRTRRRRSRRRRSRRGRASSRKARRTNRRRARGRRLSRSKSKRSARRSKRR